jgi:hypothetical protein
VITLKTLPQATAQEVFDQVARHLLTQNAKAEIIHLLGRHKCVYRDRNGLKCAAGCLIGEDEYKPEFDENGAWLNIIETFGLPEDHKDLIVQLQGIHDTVEVELWKRHLDNLAVGLGLSAAVLGEFP